MSPKIQLIKDFLVKYLAPFWKFFVGGVVVAVGFTGNFVDLKRPDVTLEITSVTTASSEPIDLMRVSELTAVRDFITVGPGLPPLPFSGLSTSAMPVEEIDRQMQIAANLVKTNSENLDNSLKKLEGIISSPVGDKTSSLAEMEEETIFVPNIVALEEAPDHSISRKPLNDEQKIDARVARIRNQIAQRRKYIDLSLLKKTNAEKQWAEYKEKTLPNKARLVVTCALGNQGAGATAIKPQAILRANLGGGNYLDLPMKLSGYESSQDLGVLPAHSYKIVRLQSDEVQAMTSADRQRYSTFLGNVSPATIYISDVNNKMYASNSVPFSPGVYEQKIYDQLKQFAMQAKDR
ncbi:hypothetical protein GJ700_17705 [Duganella sp. FT92W]|uniref:Uncharacterized protein n=1 Tax=Pseudoduganella rivuli TaxID=2666085 RepID=A0A7X2IP74_9BURK|nr:hypothetical protein [Pseudoduganella rivuli]MRV73551.1 hypothetical protein [Pseudoduganella rivuli]